MSDPAASATAARDIERGRLLVRMIYSRHEAGGPMHVWIDDLNVEDDYAPFPPVLGSDGQYEADVVAWATELSDILNHLSYTQRLTMLGVA